MAGRPVTLPSLRHLAPPEKKKKKKKRQEETSQLPTDGKSDPGVHTALYGAIRTHAVEHRIETTSEREKMEKEI